jgi:phosphate:Na+ symporter|tara:strand:+ start:42242 stop:43885 length:1644 start_codon:yes stop_codon:yes gene_type:complete
MNLVLIGGAIGGIGLFLLGMRLMTDGLKLAAGAMLRDVLTRWTRTRGRALWSGVLITGIVQSSSAVTVASIGFVNAGVLTLGQAMWVIFGSNVGTTMTGWIVALVGFDIKIEAFALPLLGIGMFLSLTGVSSRRGAFGEALAGFGVFFLGIATLKTTFAGLGQAVDLGAFVSGGILNDIMFVAIGIVMTTLVQSSSAVIAIALTAAAGGILTVEAGASLVIGANVGTTTTAALAVLGATSNARRVAVSHVVFNVLTGIVALLLLPVLLVIVDATEKTLAAGVGSTAALAVFHTVFNVLGVVLMWPLAPRLETWLAARFVTAEEDEARPRHLDDTGLALPALALDAIVLELGRVAAVAFGIARAAFLDPAASADRLRRRRGIIDALNDAIVAYVQKLSAANNAQAVAEALPHPIRALMHLSGIADLGLAVAGRRAEIAALPDDVENQIISYATLIVGQIDAAEQLFGAGAGSLPTEDATLPVYNRLKVAFLAAASRGDLSADQTEIALDTLHDLKETAHLIDRVCKRIAAIHRAAAGDIDGEPAGEGT